jgi:trigger factor
MEDLKRRLAQQGMDIETYFKVRETTEEKFLEEEAKPVAEKRLERGLVMDELARAEKIELKEEEVAQEFQQAWMSLSCTTRNLPSAPRTARRRPRNWSMPL